MPQNQFSSESSSSGFNMGEVCKAMITCEARARVTVFLFSFLSFLFALLVGKTDGDHARTINPSRQSRLSKIKIKIKIDLRRVQPRRSQLRVQVNANQALTRITPPRFSMRRS